ncbi:MAG: UDP-N-acetylmuramate:L-alanyl-gamma-D-glutamyl-meso-diaminopimelate ligase [Desulfobacteraceae bacterium]|nr:UDP-N-acetylmuramate:L-alanyl-gamma-D-glutamyl-meso-diaminopimelate ligase [Desulfobacteraceae bacterium]MBC2754211.1 UDP-N-acetylmuramate:L-alanyl-gamma-D-glutamyl-meso-diaminopimelate ligase [Desulfobacteraceae bacterium]
MSTANSIPDNVKNIHLIAVCGTGMGALACMLKDLGYAVTGSDANVYPPMSTFLMGKGVFIFEGFDGQNLAYGPDLVVVGNAVRKDNPEAVKLNEMGLSFCSMPQALNHFVVADKKALLVTGTHGKTTTSSMLAWILYVAGLDPSFMIGGILLNFDGNYRLGNGGYVVLEGDEYDTAYFDKQSKFLHFDPYVAILTSVEFDHADIFNDLSHVKATFDQFIAKISTQSSLIAYDQDENIDDLLAGKNINIPNVQRYGSQPGSRWRIESFYVKLPWNCFEVSQNGQVFGEFKIKLPGAHNRFNALSAAAAAHQLGISSDVIAKAFETYAGVKRRQEVRGVKNGVTVIDDFAHHPTAVKETIRAIRPFYPDGRLIAVFEPRTNTSMRDIFQDEYPRAFDMADIVCIRKPPLLEKIPEDCRFSSEKLVEDLKKQGKEAVYFPDTDAIIDFVAASAQVGDVVLVMSNGGFDNIHERLLKAL